MVTEMPERKLPPVAELAVATLVLVVIGGTYTAAHIPRDVPMLLPTGLTVAATTLLISNILLLSRVEDFSWSTFRRVFAWSLGGYAVISALIIYAFIRGHPPDDVLGLLAAMLILFALDIPLLFAFSVARYQPSASASVEAVSPGVRRPRLRQPARRLPSRLSK